MLQAACQQFLGKREEDIRKIALETLEGHQRAIMGNMTVEVRPDASFKCCFIFGEIATYPYAVQTHQICFNCPCLLYCSNSS